MAANPPRGAMTSEDAHESLKIETWTSALIDISDATMGADSFADFPIFHFPDYAIAIRAARLIYQAVPTTSANGSIKIGITSDDDAIVAATATADGDTLPLPSVGSVQELTLATTLKSATLQKAFGYPVVPKATTVQMDVTAGSSNAGDFVVQIDYWRITPSR